jgi:hypothetical protein
MTEMRRTIAAADGRRRTRLSNEVRRFQGDIVARVSVKAVLAGVVVDFVLSMLLGILVVFVWGLAASRGKPVAAGAQVPTDTRLLLIFLVIGLSALVLGAFVAARIAGRDHVLHGAVVGAISLAIGFLVGGSGNPSWFRILAVVLGIPMAILGAVLARRTKGSLVGRTPNA